MSAYSICCHHLELIISIIFPSSFFVFSFFAILLTGVSSVWEREARTEARIIPVIV